MANLKQITLPSGNTYDIVDQGARDLIAAIEAGSAWLGITTTPLIDGSTTNPITINGESVTAKVGNMTSYQNSEFIFNGTIWQEFGNLNLLGELAYKDNASATYTPVGNVSQPTFTGTEGNVSVSGTPSGSVVITSGSGASNYTPEGTISTPIVTVTPTTATVNSIEAVGTLPELTFTVTSENLTIAWSAGTLPTKGTDTTVATGISSVSSTQPTFTGTGVNLEAEFTGTELTSSGKYTPSGIVSKPTFTGTQATITVS